MTNNTVINLGTPEGIDPLTELLRSGAKQLITEAVQVEPDELMTHYDDQKTADVRQHVVRSGHHPEREIIIGVGKVSVEVPNIRSREGEPESFQSLIAPPYIRRTATLDAAIPWLYLKGVSSGQMQSALEAIVGLEAKGLSANVVGRLKRQWEAGNLEQLGFWDEDEASFARSHPHCGHGGHELGYLRQKRGVLGYISRQFPEFGRSQAVACRRSWKMRRRKL